MAFQKYLILLYSFSALSNINSYGLTKNICNAYCLQKLSFIASLLSEIAIFCRYSFWMVNLYWKLFFAISPFLNEEHDLDSCSFALSEERSCPSFPFPDYSTS